MIILGFVLAGLAAVIHVYIFVMESLTWTSPRTRRTFGTTEDEARVTKSMAFNQGFYNLFLALSVFIGIVVFGTGGTAVGATLVFVGAGSMALAALVLLLSNPALRRAALVQGLLPTLGVIALAVGLAA